MTSRSALDRLAAQNPITTDHAPNDIDELALQRILRTPRDAPLPVSTHRRAPVLVAAAAAVTLVVGVTTTSVWGNTDSDDPTPPAATFAMPAATGESFLLTPAGGTAEQAPPLRFVSFDQPVTTSDVVGDLAAAAAAAEPLKDGAFEYIRLRSWGFYTAQTQDGDVFDAGITDITREDWRASDGSGLMITTQDGRTDTVTVPEQPPNPGRSIPDGATVADIRQALVQSRGGSFTTDQWVDEYGEAWTGQILSPLQNAAYLEILKDRPDLDIVGETTDRAGRRGIALSASTSELRIVLILDADTGALLDVERIALTADAVEVPIALPATISYTVFEDRGRSSAMGERP